LPAFSGNGLSCDTAALESGASCLGSQAYNYYTGLKDADLADIIAYLRTLPPLQ
jgi:hypothetical protein